MVNESPFLNRRKIIVINKTLSCQKRANETLLHAGVDDVAPSLGLTRLSEIVDEGVVVPHVLLGQVGAALPVLVLGLNRVVAQVDALVEIIYLEGLGAKSEHSLCDIKL